MTTVTVAVPPVVAPVELDLEARLALADVEMTDRLARAGMAHSVNSAAPETTVDLAQVVTVPVVDPAPCVTPVAALLHRARARILRDGWCRDAAADGDAMCLTEAIRTEAHSHAEEGEARILLRRALGGDPIPEMNRRLTSASQAAQVLATAAAMATQQGL